MTILYLDTETFSETPITMGTYKYAEDASVIMWQWAIDGGPVKLSATLTDELRHYLTETDCEIVIQNSNFDRTVIRLCEGLNIPTSRIFDTMACALAHSLPGALEKLCEVLGVPQDKSKDKEGKRLIQLFCCPQKKGAFTRATPKTHPVEWKAFENYGALDVEAMREVYKRLPKWNFKGPQRELWELDQQINDRGILIDRRLAQGAIYHMDEAKNGYKARTVELTDGAVDAPTKRDALITWINTKYGIQLDEMTKASVSTFLENTSIPEHVRELLEIRLESNKASVAKYKKVEACVSKDDRLRGTMQYCGAYRTGRSAGRLFQPLNLPRGQIHDKELDQVIELLSSPASNLGSYTGTHSVPEMCASSLRGLIIPPPGKKLVVADWSNIEGRMLAWLAGEQWKIKAYADFDTGKGHDLYNLTYARAFGKKVEEVTKQERQIGKVMELAFGYGGGVGAWITFALAYGIDLEELAKVALSKIPDSTIKESERFLVWIQDQGKDTYGLSEQAFYMCDGFKRLWRTEHPAIESYWKELELACSQAIQADGEIFTVGFHKIQKSGTWLRVKLPSGRYLNYAHPKVDSDGKITYYDQRKKGERASTYGGKLSENITQAASADILRDGMFRAEEKGYEIILSVYDEIVTETPVGEVHSIDDLCRVLSINPSWATGLPLAAAGFESLRYRKD